MKNDARSIANFSNADIAPAIVHEAELILPNMRGACVTVGTTVHTLFRLSPRANASRD